MEPENTTLAGFIELVKKNGVSTILIAVLCYFGSQYLQKIEKIEDTLAKIQIELIEIKHEFASKEEVDTKIEKAITKHEDLYHKNK